MTINSKKFYFISAIFVTVCAALMIVLSVVDNDFGDATELMNACVILASVWLWATWKEEKDGEKS